MKPYDSRISCPSSESTKATNAAASSALPDSDSAASGYSAMTLNSSGTSMPSTSSPADRTSVWYTSPASRSPASTLVSRLRTSGSSVSWAGVTPALARASRPNWPQGTSSAQRPMFRSALPKASSPSTLPGLPAGTAISSSLVAKVSGWPSTASASTSWSMLEVLAEANTSDGAPARICSRSADEAPKFISTVVPGFSSSNVLAISPKASVSDAAANTVIDPVGPSASVVWVVAALSSSSPLPQAAASTSNAPRHQRRRWLIDMSVPLESG